MVSIFYLFLGIKGRLNFLQFSRYGSYNEKTYRNNFQEAFDFLQFNKILLDTQSTQVCAIAFDPSYVSKSGKNTPGVGHFWSGVAGSSKWGLEFCGIAALDKENHTAYHLDAFQTIGIYEGESLVDFYARKIIERKDMLGSISRYVVADAYFSKKNFVNVMNENDFEVISRLRDDADLLYLFEGEQTKGRGRPKKYDGKVDFKDCSQLRFSLVADSEDGQEKIFSGIGYSKSLQKNVNVVIVYTKGKDGKYSHKNYFSTDLEQSWSEILEIYRLRFQIEFLYRDAKQHLGLNHCEARSEEKLTFHINTSLTSINLAKIAHWKKNKSEERFPFSISDVKTLYNNQLLLDLFLEEFGINPYLPKNKRRLHKLRRVGLIAA